MLTLNIMPGFDKTGPAGQGSMTGRGAGPCNPNTNQNCGFGRGAGCRRGFGMGRGFGRGGWFRGGSGFDGWFGGFFRQSQNDDQNNDITPSKSGKVKK